MLDRLTTGLEFQTQALLLRAERQRMLAGNIANADTPGYQAQEFNFSKALQMATDAAGASAPNAATAEGRRGLVQSTREFALQAQTNLDGNGVDMDRERASFADNSLRYEATLRFINGSLRTMLDSMKSHNSPG
ncbi:flagellar basal body rod protein FlgB [Inhella gelatinilytica]|uniref:Flagellar basal body rod protein FlgB n=1 Tax=Inhella gelatinilytica TaxID=2795030 RepID=A0A931IWP2_9BURK|nr:flagellar basal body rod protein FlgB [Inhella gelatinilytica]MBH9553539.1 flagellar basal body rod protein FlgB [Inhella gelatinilytica]